MLYFRIGTAEFGPGANEEKLFTDLLDALRETDERLQVSECWRFIRVIAEQTIVNNDFDVEGLTAGQFAVFVLGFEGSAEINEDGEPFSRLGSNLIVNPREVFKAIEIDFLEGTDDVGNIDEDFTIRCFKNFYFLVSEELGG